MFIDLANRSLILVIGIVIVIVAAGIYYVSTSLGPNGESVTTSEVATSPMSAKGEEIYTDYCAGCHGAKGVGGVGPKLSANNADRSVIENGNLDEGMPAFKEELSLEEMQTKVSDLRQELFNLNFQHETGQLENSQKLTQTKRDIARLKTIIKEVALKPDTEKE